MDNTVHERLQVVFRKVFNNTVLVITLFTSAKDVASWDSLMHIELIAAVEEEFGISFSFNEVMKFDNAGDMIRLIEQKLKK